LKRRLTSSSDSSLVTRIIVSDSAPRLRLNRSRSRSRPGLRLPVTVRSHGRRVNEPKSVPSTVTRAAGAGPAVPARGRVHWQVPRPADLDRASHVTARTPRFRVPDSDRDSTAAQAHHGPWPGPPVGPVVRVSAGRGRLRGGSTAAARAAAGHCGGAALMLASARRWRASARRWRRGR
jgi:hypothetical protein